MMSEGQLKKQIDKAIIEVQKEQADFDCLDYSYKTDVVIEEAKKKFPQKKVYDEVHCDMAINGDWEKQVDKWFKEQFGASK